MAVNQAVVDAYIRLYSEAQLETALQQALGDFASGVTITQVTFEGGGASGQKLEGNPTMLIETLEEALKQIADAERKARPNSTFMDLSQRPYGT